jgi:hypothetical protein
MKIKLKNKEDLNTIRNVEIYVEFIRIGEIDTMNEKYQAELNIESKWVETENSYDTYNPNFHWNPKLFIENVLQEPKEQISYEKKIRSDGNFVVIEKRNIKGVFWEKLEYIYQNNNSFK